MKRSGENSVPAVLVDASGLVALLDADDRQHARGVAALKQIHRPLATVWPALTEAMHLLSATRNGPNVLCEMVEDGLLALLPLDIEDFARMRVLMEKYRDLPMDFADAALVRVAERDRLTQILTFDRHFGVYRLPRRMSFTVLPGW